MARGGLTRSREGHKGFLGGDGVRGWPRNDTDDHGMGFRVVLVLSAAVLVIVIDARAAGRAGVARVGGFSQRR